MLESRVPRCQSRRGGERVRVMPRKGLPRCKCGWSSWLVIKNCESSTLIRCKRCWHQCWTQSNARLALYREQQCERQKAAAAEKGE